MKKSAIAIMMTAIIFASLFVPLLLTAQATTLTTNGVTVDGVLASDSYVLYPYSKTNLYLGISKYGELINGEASTKVGLKYGIMDVFANPYVGETDWSQGWYIDIHYADNDNNYQNIWAFAMYTDLSGNTSAIGGDWKEACVNGPLGAPNGGRKTNAWATSAPITVLYDGPRESIVMTNTTIYSAATKTAGDALVGVVLTFVFDKDKKCVVVFKDIKRLNPGKWTRTFQVEFSNRGEWDIGATSAPPSYANFYDDQPTVYNGSYHDYYSTNSTLGYDVAQMINQAGTYVGFAAYWPPLFGKIVDGTTHLTRTKVLSSLCTQMFNTTWGLADNSTGLKKWSNDTFRFSDEPGWPTADSYPRGAGVWSDEPMVFKNGILLSGAGVDYTWTSDDKIVFTVAPIATDYIIVVYKHQLPTDGGADNMASHTAEPDTPYVIGEWVFDLKSADKCRQFRAVTVYGLTDRHDADDVNTVSADRFPTGWSFGLPTMDSEVKYYLNETFNPWDLNDAVEKQEFSYVDIRNLTSATVTNNITLTKGVNDQLYYAKLPSEVTAVGRTTAGWTGYFVKDSDEYPAESVWVNTFQNSPLYPAGDPLSVAHSKNWALKLDGSTGYEMLKVTPIAGTPTTAAPLTLQLKDLVDFGFWYKFVGTTGYGPHIEIKVSSTAAGGESGQTWANIAAENSNPEKSTTEWTHYTLNNIEDFVGATSADTAFFVTGGNATIDSGFHSFEYFTADDKLGNYYVNSIGIQTQDGAIAYVDDLSVAYLDRASGIRYERVYNMEENKLIPSAWNGYCVFPERVLVNGVLYARAGYQSLFAPYYTINFGAVNSMLLNVTFYTGLGALSTLPVGTYIKVLYNVIEENDRGRYEWATVGRDAQTVDSAGLSLVTAAFKDKDIEIGLAGEDMASATAANQMPSVMSKTGTGNTRADYYYSGTDYRTGLADDWCTKWAVARSNMIGVGGPYANMLSYYGNDFATAMFGLPDFAGTAYSGKIVPVSCWNRGWNGTWNTYASGTVMGTFPFSSTAGYAVISAYKDINGTVLFLVWGYYGQDTYYATQWLNGDAERGILPGIWQLQDAPHGITSIILQISYPTLDPTHPTFHIVECLGTISETLWTHGLELKGGIHDP